MSAMRSRIRCSLGLGEKGRAFDVGRENKVEQGLGAAWRLLLDASKTRVFRD